MVGGRCSHQNKGCSLWTRGRSEMTNVPEIGTVGNRKFFQNFGNRKKKTSEIGIPIDLYYGPN